MEEVQNVDELITELINNEGYGRKEHTKQIIKQLNGEREGKTDQYVYSIISVGHEVIKRYQQKNEKLEDIEEEEIKKLIKEDETQETKYTPTEEEQLIVKILFEWGALIKTTKHERIIKKHKREMIDIIQRAITEYAIPKQKILMREWELIIKELSNIGEKREKLVQEKLKQLEFVSAIHIQATKTIYRIVQMDVDAMVEEEGTESAQLNKMITFFMNVIRETPVQLPCQITHQLYQFDFFTLVSDIEKTMVQKKAPGIIKLIQEKLTQKYDFKDAIGKGLNEAAETKMLEYEEARLPLEETSELCYLLKELIGNILPTKPTYTFRKFEKERNAYWETSCAYFKKHDQFLPQLYERMTQLMNKKVTESIVIAMAWVTILMNKLHQTPIKGTITQLSELITEIEKLNQPEQTKSLWIALYKSIRLVMAHQQETPILDKELILAFNRKTSKSKGYIKSIYHSSAERLDHGTALTKAICAYVRYVGKHLHSKEINEGGIMVNQLLGMTGSSMVSSIYIASEMISSANFIGVLPTLVEKMRISFAYVENTHEGWVREISHSRMQQYIETLGHLIPQVTKRYENTTKTPFTTVVCKNLKQIVYSLLRSLPKCIQTQGELIIQCLGELLVCDWFVQDKELMMMAAEQWEAILKQQYTPDVIYFKKRQKKKQPGGPTSLDEENDEDIEFKLAMATHSWFLSFYTLYPQMGQYTRLFEKSDELVMQFITILKDIQTHYAKAVQSKVLFDLEAIERLAQVKVMTAACIFFIQDSETETDQLILLDTIQACLHALKAMIESPFKADATEAAIIQFLKQHHIYKRLNALSQYESKCQALKNLFESCQPQSRKSSLKRLLEFFQ